MRYIKFWGVRGSIPTPGAETVGYGGNTACIELRLGDHIFILDAGSGLRNLGNSYAQEDIPLHFSIFFSHTHWDHIQGLPFYMPAYNPKNKLTFYGPGNLDQILSGQMQPDYFPLKIENLNADLEFQSLEPGTHTIQDMTVEVFSLNHPGKTYGYRFKTTTADIVYISDNEPLDVNIDADPLMAFVQKADILIHDAQYTPEEYPNHKGWGHSPFTYPLELALASQVKRLVLFHHDPQHSDDAVDDILARAKQIVSDRSSGLDVIAAAEGMSIEI